MGDSFCWRPYYQALCGRDSSQYVGAKSRCTLTRGKAGWGRLGNDAFIDASLVVTFVGELFEGNTLSDIGVGTRRGFAFSIFDHTV